MLRRWLSSWQTNADYLFFNKSFRLNIPFSSGLAAHAITRVEYDPVLNTISIEGFYGQKHPQMKPLAYDTVVLPQSPSKDIPAVDFC